MPKQTIKQTTKISSGIQLPNEPLVRICKNEQEIYEKEIHEFAESKGYYLKNANGFYRSGTLMQNGKVIFRFSNVSSEALREMILVYEANFLQKYSRDLKKEKDEMVNCRFSLFSSSSLK